MAFPYPEYIKCKNCQSRDIRRTQTLTDAGGINPKRYTIYWCENCEVETVFETKLTYTLVDMSTESATSQPMSD